MENFLLYLAYVGVSLALLAVATAIYLAVTPYRELALIQAGNEAAAYSLTGSMIGFAQILAYLAVSLLLKGFRAGIEGDKIGYGLTLGGVSVAVGILNAGALTN